MTKEKKILLNYLLKQYKILNQNLNNRQCVIQLEKQMNHSIGSMDKKSYHHFSQYEYDKLLQLIKTLIKQIGPLNKQDIIDIFHDSNKQKYKNSTIYREISKLLDKIYSNIVDQ